MRLSAVVALVAMLFAGAMADVYLHWLRGSNNRLNEANVNVNNQNRVFDSQNNAKGGYVCGTNSDTGTDCFPMYFFEESMVKLEWTQQHACGNNSNTFCQLVLQYSCQEDKTYNGEAWVMTDGTQTNGDPPATGLNEPIAMRTKCERRTRNEGLFIADRNLNGNTAAYTRQNNNGDKYGTECPEERDYYPYWHPTIWKDIAVLTNSPEICPFYKAESANVKPKHECECSAWTPSTGCGTNNDCWAHNNQAACSADANCKWQAKTFSTLFGGVSSTEEDNLGAPECSTGPADFWARDNHLGNTKSGESPTYWWKLPNSMQACGSPTGCSRCYFRLRYNITTADYHELEKWQLPSALEKKNNLDHYFWVDSRLNGKRSIKMDNNTNNFFEDDPVIDMGVGGGLAIALNTAQTGRVFQDRSFLFSLKTRPEAYEGKKIWNLGVRGKRGNIVQCYPAVEYDFVPGYLEISEDDVIHVQWIGGNTNPNGNDGQGQAGTDRNNLIEFESPNRNYPKAVEDYTLFDHKTQLDIIRAFATSGRGVGADTQLNNASPYFDSYAAMGNKLLSLKPGTYYYGSTRNNNFTNRSQKGTIKVNPASTD